MTEPYGLVDLPVTELLELSLALHFSAKTVATLGLKGGRKLHDVTVLSGRRGNGGKTEAGGMADAAP